MEKYWKRDELEKLDKPGLRKILEDRGQNTTGYREQLIRRIVEEVPLKLTVKPKTEKQPIGEREFSLLSDIPRDILFETLFKLDYEDVVKTCRTSTIFNKICQDERFWKDYAFRHNIKRENSDETWRITVKYHGKMSRFSSEINGRVLTGIVWILTKLPDNLYFRERNNGNVRDIPIPKEEYNKIVFRKVVYVAIPKLIEGNEEDPEGMFIIENYGQFKKWDSVFLDEPLPGEPQYVIKIKPNTTYGSTLKHVLNLIYKGIWGLPMSGTRPLSELIGNIRFLRIYFGGLQIPSKKENYYKLIMLNR